MNARNVEKRFKRWWYLFTKFHAFFHETFSTTTDTKFMFAMKCLRLIVLQFGFLSYFQTMKFYGWTRIPYRHVTVLLLYIIFNRYNVDIRSSSTPRITVHVSHHLIFCFANCNIESTSIQGLKFQYFLQFYKKFFSSVN